MTPAEVMKQVSIPRRRLYYLEQVGFISPKKTRAGELEFRDYSETELEKIRVIWKYLKQGYRFYIAREKAEKELNSHKLAQSA